MVHPELALRFRGGERHHLFNNNGTWFVRYSVRPAPHLKAERRAESLGVRDLSSAKLLRDRLLAVRSAELLREATASNGGTVS